MKPEPFAYPSGAHVRRHGPSGWKDYGKYRPWLRDEFCFRCVYCLNREQWIDPRRAYQIDHFLPQKIRPDLKSDYDNLLYLCAPCNNLKGATVLPDPCKIPLKSSIAFQFNGTIRALDDSGEFIIEILQLDRPELVDFRRRKIGILKSLYESNMDQFTEEMTFPQDLPDLSELPPKSNSRPDGVQESWFSKCQRGEIPAVY